MGEKKRLLFFVLGGIFLILSYFVLKPFLSSILTGLLLSYLLYPLYLRVLQQVKYERLAAFLVLIGIILLLLLPSLLLLDRLTKETILFYTYGKELLANGLPCVDGETLGCRFVRNVNLFLRDPQIAHTITIMIQQASIAMVNAASGVALQSVLYLLDIFLIILVSYYAFLEGPSWSSYFFSFMPENEYIARQLQSVSYAIVVGSFLVAVLEGILGFLAFTIVGIEAPLFWGVVIAFTAIVPFVSATAIWLPALLYKFFLGQFPAVLILLFFGLLLFYVDNFLRSYLVGARAKVHPLLVFIGIVGGIQLLGIGGLILGPFILSFSVLLLKVYQT